MLIQIALALSLTQAGPIQGADLNQKVTIEQRAAPVSVVVAQLAAATRTPLSASASLWSEVVAFKVKDVKLIDLMNRIADATSCEWYRTDQGFAMRRSNSKVANDDKQWLATRTLAIGKRLDQLKAALPGPMTEQQILALRKQRDDLQKEMSESNADPTVWQRYAALQKKEPSQSLMSEAVLLIGANQLAAVRRDERIVYSTRPTQMQRPMPGGFDDAYARYLAAEELWGETGSVGEEMSVPAMEVPSGSEEIAQAEVQDEPARSRIAATTHIIVERSDQFMPGSLTIRLQTYDRMGESIKTQRTQLDSMDEAVAESMMNDFKIKDGEKEITLSQDAVEFGKLLSPAMGGELGALTEEVKDRWRDRILNLDKYEPLSYGASEMTFALADEKGLNVVAVIPDLFAMFTPAVSDEFKLTVRTLRILLTSLPIVTFTEDAGWLTIRPTFPSESRLARTNRPAASTYLRQVEKAGRATVDVLARYIASSEALSFDNLGMMLQSAISGSRNLENYTMIQREALLRFYGRLQPEQRTALLRGGTLALANLPTELAAPVHQILFGANAKLTRDEIRPPISDESGDAEEYAYGEYSSGGGALVTEPTQAMPTGIPARATVSVVSTNRSLIQSYETTDQENQYGAPQSLQSIAFEIFCRERPDLFPWAKENAPRLYYKLFGVTDLLFTFSVGPRISAKSRLRDIAPTTAGKPVKFDALPVGVREEIMRLVNKQREQHKNSKPEEYEEEVEPDAPASKP